MRRARTVLCALLCGVLLSVLPGSTAMALTPQQKAQARELYGKGQQLFKEGNFAEAERSFEEAYRVAPNPVVLLSIAECQVRTEQYQRAIDSLEAYLREKPDARDAHEVTAQIEALRAKPASVTLRSDVPGANVWLDENATGSVTPAELTLSPGQHVVALEHEGYERTEQSVVVHPGERRTIDISLTPVQVAAPPAAPTPAPVAEQKRGPRHTSAGFWAATGIGAAGLVTGVTLGALALTREKDFKDHPTKKTADQGERMALFADVGFGIAGVAAVTALVVYLTSGKKGEPTEHAWTVAPALSSQGAGMAAHAKF